MALDIFEMFFLEPSYLCVGDLTVMIPQNNTLILSSKARLQCFSAALSVLSLVQYP